MRTHPRKLVCSVAAGLALGGLASAAYQAAGEARDRRRYPPPGELVDIGGRRLHLLRAGEGGPAVVIASSLGESGVGWAEVQGRLAQHTTVVAYDRAGLGWSDPGPWPTPTARRMVEDLHRLLAVASIPPPYVLVGHSAGGLLMRLYAGLQPEQVADLALVDPSHPDQQRRLRASLTGWRVSRTHWWLRTAKSAFRPLGLARLRADLRAKGGHGVDILPHLRRSLSPRVAEGAVAMRRSSRERRADVGEMLMFPSLAAAVGRAVDGTPGSLGQLPLLVISRGPDTADLWPPTAEATWQELQADLALLSKRSIHLHAESGDHFVHRADPDLVVGAIVDLLASLQRLSADQ